MPRTSWLRRHRAALAASIAVAAGFAWLLHRGALPLVPAREAFAGIRPWTVVAYGALYLTALYVRSHRWTWLLEPVHPVPLRRVLAVSFIGYGALVLLPFRTGEVVRPALIRKEGKLSGWAATGTIAAERVIDGLVLAIILLVALTLAKPLDPLPDHIGDLAVPVALVPAAAYAALVLFAAAFLVLGAFYFFRSFATRAIEAIVGIVSKGFARRLSEAAGRVADGLHFLPRVRHAGPFLAATLLYYALNAAGIELLLWGAGIEPVDLARACVIMGVLHLGVLVPNAPGYFGAFQISIYAGLAMYYPPARVASTGSAVVFLLYALQIGLVLAAALVALLAERLTPGEALAAEDEPVAP
jgi:glycosyltransferase 2 family protein